ncbi:MATE family efflux transporter [Nostoc sp. 'Lobaria pulmonaria (5183) cyanobiont']|uniref:MATE family efflux transporter n=1 Tax=Nostoc sp. 'Lobaria pulmonaria (5183) cyanobiont' TaxID=1618022 RepID=UPI000CF330A2|nr:MATE family efflux transporter [Nostoc sp. 'Lobaria pulmonaria (5183) cyanobiont']AVH69228.1 MATE efflux family protein [Nostoc sp. 'Lobaria pulmonaria (5183) cyanobiont']
MTAQKQSKITNEILQGNLIKLMFKLSIPSILGTLMVSLNSFIDALFAGRFLNETALAGILLALPFTSIVEGFAALIGVGSASVLSRAIGSGDIKTQSKIFGNLIIMSVVISFFITIIGYVFGKELIAFMGGSGQVALEGTKYLKTYILGSVFFIGGTACGEIISSEGQIRLTTISMSIFVIINILLNYIFLTVFHWGTSGIALATIIAMVFSSIVNLAYFIFGKSFISVNLKKLAIAIDLLPATLSVGMSSLFAPVMMLAQGFVVFNSISYYGTNNDIAFFGATQKVTSLVFIPVVGFAQALQPIIGMNYGAKNHRRIKKAYLTFAIIGTILLLLIWLPLQLSPRTFLGIILPSVNFTEDDIFNFRLLSILAPVWPLASFSNTLFQSIGKGKTILVVLLLRTICLYVPMVLFYSRIYGLKGIYYGMLFADVIFMFIVFILTVLEFQSLSKLKVE